MSASMFLGRVALPAIGLAVAVTLAWNAGRTITARTEVIRSAEPSHSVDRPAGRITAEGRVVAYPGALVAVGTEVIGTITNMPARENLTVRKGDLLVELRADDVKASLREARYRLVEAEVGVRLQRARMQLDRMFPSPTGRGPQQTAESRAEEQSAIVARRDAASATVDRLEAEAAKYRMTAPIDGTVISRLVQPGETVAAGSALVTIVDLKRLRIEAEVDEFDISGITLAAKGTITAEGYASRRWQCEVEEIPEAVVARQVRPDDPGRASDTRVLRVKLAFREPTPLRLGQHVEVDIARGKGKK